MPIPNWATDISQLSWIGGCLMRPISHAVALDFPYCCVHNQPWKSLTIATGWQIRHLQGATKLEKRLLSDVG